MADFVVIAVVAAIVLAAGGYVYNAKKKGVKCIGCSVGEGCCGCSGQSGESSSCGCSCDTKK